MAKEWILNSAMNRFQLNFKRNVGPISESIRKCEPKTLEEWQEYYFSNVRSREHIIDFGRKKDFKKRHTRNLRKNLAGKCSTFFHLKQTGKKS
ncbi:hypothetical protein ES705_39254 [subsurface metagenome]